jgi:CHAD domain-containing protein
MAYRIERGEAPERALRRIAGEQLDRAVAEIEGGADPDETIHVVRKRTKKLRGLVRLFRAAFPAYRAENAGFRDAARRLSELRDAATQVACCQALATRFADDVGAGPFDAGREVLLARRAEIVREIDAGERLDEVREALRAAAERIGTWRLEAGGFDAIEGGLAKTYARARRGMTEALSDPTIAALHEWRKRVKYLRYHLLLLREVWPPVMRPLRDSAKRLSDLLGDDHDLAMLRATLVGEAGRFEPTTHALLLGLIEQRRAELQAWSIPLGQRLLADPPGALRRRMARLWNAWIVEQRLGAALPEDSCASS